MKHLSNVRCRMPVSLSVTGRWNRRSWKRSFWISSITIRCTDRHEHCGEWHRRTECKYDHQHNAQQFGLSDLHQLRGRVGRSNRKAFCYLLSPPLSSLTQEARRRLQAIENFSELGSGTISPCRTLTSGVPVIC